MAGPLDVPIQKSGERRPNTMILLWGPSGSGKTTMSATLPGKKLLVNFDPGGPDAIGYRDDTDVWDLSTSDPSVAREFKNDSNPIGLRDRIDGYDSIIVDSLTTAAERATLYSINSGLFKGAMVERPSPGAYGGRNALLLSLVSGTMRLCALHNKNLCMIAHEGTPEKDDENVITSIPMYLGGQLPNQTALRFSEVWALYQLNSGRDRAVAIRNGIRQRQPCKSRMFDVSGGGEWIWKYDPETDTGHRIADFHEQWLKGGMKKIKPPK